MMPDNSRKASSKRKNKKEKKNANKIWIKDKGTEFGDTIF